MTVNLNPYLSFRDNAREAMEFYTSVFGGELSVSTFGEMNASEDPSEAGKIMHGQLVTPNKLVLMGSDTPNTMEHTGNNAQISLSGGPEDDAELRGYWDRLAEGATVLEALQTAPWGDAFGMLTDRFGTLWMINISAGAAGAQP